MQRNSSGLSTVASSGQSWSDLFYSIFNCWTRPHSPLLPHTSNDISPLIQASRQSTPPHRPNAGSNNQPFHPGFAGSGSAAPGGGVPHHHLLQQHQHQQAPLHHHHQQQHHQQQPTATDPSSVVVVVDNGEDAGWEEWNGDEIQDMPSSPTGSPVAAPSPSSGSTSTMNSFLDEVPLDPFQPSAAVPPVFSPHLFSPISSIPSTFPSSSSSSFEQQQQQQQQASPIELPQTSRPAPTPALPSIFNPVAQPAPQPEKVEEESEEDLFADMEPEYKAPTRLAVEQTATPVAAAEPAPAAQPTAAADAGLFDFAADTDAVPSPQEQLDFGLDDHEVDHGAWSDDDTLFGDDSAAAAATASSETPAAAAPTASPSKNAGGRKPRVKKEKVVLTKAKVSFDEDF